MATTGEKSHRNGESVSTVVLGVLFVLGGVAGLGYGLNTVLQVRRMNSWPTTTAVIVTADTRRQSPRSGGGSATTIAEIRYRYEVSGQTYTSDRVTTARYGTGNSSRANEQVRRYPVGRKVMAHYRPDDASLAVLETVWDKVYGLAFAAGAAGIVLGAAMLRNAAKGRE